MAIRIDDLNADRLKVHGFSGEKPENSDTSLEGTLGSIIAEIYGKMLADIEGTDLVKKEEMLRLMDELNKGFNELQEMMNQVTKNTGDPNKLGEDINAKIDELRGQVEKIAPNGDGGTAESAGIRERLLGQLEEVRAVFSTSLLLSGSSIEDLEKGLKDIGRMWQDLTNKGKYDEEEWDRVLTFLQGREKWFEEVIPKLKETLGENSETYKVYNRFYESYNTMWNKLGRMYYKKPSPWPFTPPDKIKLRDMIGNEKELKKWLKKAAADKDNIYRKDQFWKSSGNNKVYPALAALDRLRNADISPGDTIKVLRSMGKDYPELMAGYNNANTQLGKSFGDLQALNGQFMTEVGSARERYEALLGQMTDFLTRIFQRIDHAKQNMKSSIRGR